MEIIRSISLNGNINTDLYDFLASIPEGILFNTEHSLRKPLGIYNVSSNRVFNAFSRVLEVLNKKDFEYIELTECYKELLHSLMSFIDDSYHMMKCLFPANCIEKNIPFADRWLEKLEPKLIKQYKDSISEYRDRLSKIVNKIKHNHAFFANIKMTTNAGVILGYCIVGVNDKEEVIPDEEIHKPIGNMATGFSYYKDIRFHIVNYYLVASQILKTMNSMISKKYGDCLTRQNVDYSGVDNIWTIFNQINNLRHLFFPDEYNSNMPQIELEQNGQSIRLRYPSTKTYLNRLFRYSGWKVEFTTSGDGVSKPYKVPYIGD